MRKTGPRPQRALSEQEQIRRDKLAALVSQGKDPYQVMRYDVTWHSASAIAEYERLEAQFRAEHGDDADAENHECAPHLEVSMAGRMMSRRIMGQGQLLPH